MTSPNSRSGVGDLAASLAGVAVSLRDDVPADRVLAELSDLLLAILPHDRLVVDCLDENQRTFRVFAEHVVHGPVLHEDHYTTDAARDARYTVADWTIRRAFAGEALLIGDFATDPRYAEPNEFEKSLVAGGVRAGVVVPLRCGGHVIGLFVATSLAADVYGDEHLRLARQVADQIAPA